MTEIQAKASCDSLMFTACSLTGLVTDSRTLRKVTLSFQKLKYSTEWHKCDKQYTMQQVYNAATSCGV